LDDSNEHLLGSRTAGTAASTHTGSANSMSEQAQDSLSGVASAADVRRVTSLFATDRTAALALIRDLLQRQQPPGMVLQHLNKFGRPDIVAAFFDGLSHDAKTPDLIVFEHARALAANGAPHQGEKILEEMSAARARDYAFQYSAGRLLSELRRHAQALKYYDKAFRIKPTSQVVERVFTSHVALEQYAEAAKAMGRLLRAGSYRPGLGKEFAFLLERIPTGELDPEIAYALATVPGTEGSIAAALMPHLVAADLLDSVLARLQQDSEKAAALDEASLLAVIPYLARRGQIEPLLRVYERYGASSPAVNACFTQVLGDLPPSDMAQFLSPRLTGFLDERKPQGEAKTYLEAAQRFGTTGDPDAALAMLQLLPRVIAPVSAETFYAREKTRLARLAGFVTERLGSRDDVLNSLALFVTFWIKPVVRDFFSGPEFADLMDIVAAAKTLRDAPAASHAAHLREDYFEHYLERRSDQSHETAGDFEFCEMALSYFSALSHQRPVATVPAGESLTSRLGRRVLSMGNGRPIDALAAFGLLQNRPQISLTQPKAYHDFCWWYLSALAGTGKVPPACLQPEVVAYLDEAAASGDLPGLCTSRFLKLVWSNSEAYRKRFDFGNAIDRMLFVIEMVTSVLPRNTQFLPFFSFLFDADQSGGLPQRVITQLTGSIPTVRPIIRVDGAAQDILLVGHASKESGLGRNFAMLSNALTMESVKLAGFDYDWTAAMVHEELGRWFKSCRSRPIAVFAVNAQDVPDFFVKDRSGILFDCFTTGFFLWEVSRPAAVQKLGAALVDEIWAPTRYVADVYAPLNRTYVVGKGLFRGDEAFLSHQKTPGTNAAFRFVTVFDFDSSIERKNPLAVVLAFLKAFPAGENVELVVKTSNVNPRHWSNSERHWERLMQAASSDPRIKIITTRLSDAEMIALVRDADCVVSLHRSEGFGYLMSDAMAYGTPVIATDYSGNADFCDPDTAWPVPYRLISADKVATRWPCDGAEWADADVEAAASQMRLVFENYGNAMKKAARARANIVEKYAVGTFRATLTERIAAIRSKLR